MAEAADLRGAAFLAAARSRLVTRTDLQRFQASAASDSFHSYDPREKERYTTRINKIMATEPEFKPLHPGSNDLFKIVSDGRWLCKFLNRCEPGAVDESALAKSSGGSGGAKTKATGANPWQNTEHLNAFLEACKASGLEFGNVGSADFAKADEMHKEHLILGVIWQLLRRQMANELRDMLAKQAAEAEAAAAAAASAGYDGSAAAAEAAATSEAMARAMKDPESFLCDWVNTCLKERGVELPRYAGAVSDLSTTHTDLLCHLVHSLEPSEASEAAIASEDPLERANLVIQWASEHGIPSLTQPDDLRDTNPRLILPFVMGVFTWYHTQQTAAREGKEPGLPSSLWVVRQHWHVESEDAAARSCTSNTVCIFKREDEALKYCLTENLALVGTDADLPHLLTMSAAYAEAAGFTEDSVTESLGPIPTVLAKPEEVEEDDADLLRARVEEWVRSLALGDLKHYQELLANILQSHPTVKLYALDSAQVY